MRRALGLRRDVAAAAVAVVLLVMSLLYVRVGLGSSVIDNEFGALPFFLFPLVDVFRDNPCVIGFSDLYFEWLRFLHLLQFHSSRLPTFWLVFLLSFGSLTG